MKKYDPDPSIDLNDPSTWPTPPNNLPNGVLRKDHMEYGSVEQAPRLTELEILENRYANIQKILARPHDVVNKISSQLAQNELIPQEEMDQMHNTIKKISSLMGDVWKVIIKYITEIQQANISSGKKSEFYKNYQSAMKHFQQLQKNFGKTQIEYYKRIPINYGKLLQAKKNRSQTQLNKEI